MKKLKEVLNFIAIFVGVCVIVAWPLSAIFWIWTYNLYAAKVCASYAVIGAFFGMIYSVTKWKV